MIETLKRKFKVRVGYSGHEKSISPSLMAVCLGAEVIERHVTVDRTMWGTDQAASLEKNGMTALAEMIRKFETCKGDGIKRFLPTEKDKLRDAKYW
jgi:N-acetylneuraminate synthase